MNKSLRHTLSANIMNEAFFKHAMSILDNMSEDDMSESMFRSGFRFETKVDIPIYVIFTEHTARPVEFRKRVLSMCRESLQDDEWAFSKSHGVFGTTATSYVAVVVWDGAHAAILKLLTNPETKVEVTFDEPAFGS